MLRHFTRQRTVAIEAHATEMGQPRHFHVLLVASCCRLSFKAQLHFS